MTKKDYQLIAHALFQSRYVNDLEKNKVKRQAAHSILRLTVSHFTSALQQDNPSFNKEKFIEACRINY